MCDPAPRSACEAMERERPLPKSARQLYTGVGQVDVESNVEVEGVGLVASPGWIEGVPLQGGCGTAAAGDHACSTTCTCILVLPFHHNTQHEVGILPTEFGAMILSADGYHSSTPHAQHLGVLGQATTPDP